MYNVVLRHKEDVGIYAGITSWKDFISKEELDKVRTGNTLGNREIVAEGISVEDCVRICYKTSFWTHFKVALHRTNLLEARGYGPLALISEMNSLVGIRRELVLHQTAT